MVDNAEKIAQVSLCDDRNIKGFFGMHRFLSNYHMAPIIYDGNVYGSTEAAYQAAKTLNDEDKEFFFTCTPSQAKKYGGQLIMRQDWSEIKNQVMYDVCLFKFTYHTDLRNCLLATNSKHLEESNWWKDTYWGTYEGAGRNQLGITLMKIRSSLKKLIIYQI